MRHRRWIELIKDYDLNIKYYEGKANVVVDALSRNSSHSINALVESEELCRDIQRLSLEILNHGEIEARLSVLSLRLSVFDDIKEGQVEDEQLD